MEKKISSNSPFIIRISLAIFIIVSLAHICYAISLSGQSIENTAAMGALSIVAVTICIAVVKGPLKITGISHPGKTYKFVLKAAALIAGLMFTLAGILGIISKSIPLHGGKLGKGDFAVIGGMVYLILGITLILGAIFLKAKQE